MLRRGPAILLGIGLVPRRRRLHRTISTNAANPTWPSTPDEPVSGGGQRKVSDAIYATEMLSVTRRNHSNSYALRYRTTNGVLGEVVFPSDQLEILIEAALAVEHAHSGETSSSAALLAESFKLDAQIPHQVVLLELHVGNRKFAFSLLRDHARRLLTSLSEVLPRTANISKGA